jgi:hypothetical protein
MFKHLTDFSIQRTVGQAFGFWLSYLLLASIIGAVAGGIYGSILTNGGYEEGLAAGQLITIPYVAVLSLLICAKKSLGFLGYLLTAIATLLAFIGGAFLGLIPTAYLTVRPSNSFVPPEADDRL